VNTPNDPTRDAAGALSKDCIWLIVVPFPLRLDKARIDRK
jgi:hypothetical protein